MLRDRGYMMEDNPNFEEFMVMHENKNFDLMDQDKKTYISFYQELKSFGKKDLENTVSNIKEHTYPDIKIIIILKEKYNVAVEKELGSAPYKNVEIFLYKDLIINITKHVYQPKFKPLSEADMNIILETYQCNKNQFPKMLVTDPVARYYGMKSGNMIKIIRNSPSAAQAISYRLIR